MRTLIRRAGSALVAVIALTGAAAAQTAPPNASMSTLLAKDLMFGAKAGLISGGTVTAEGAELSTDASYSIGGFLDYRLSPKLYGGATLDLHNMSMFDDSKMLIDLGLTMKALIANESSKVAFRPGFGLGYGNVGAIEGVIDGTSYLTIRAFVEALLPTDGNVSWLGELGIIGGPSGGNSDADVTFGPMFLIRAGAAF